MYNQKKKKSSFLRAFGRPRDFLDSRWAFVKDVVSDLVHPRIELLCLSETKLNSPIIPIPYTNYLDPEPYGKQFFFFFLLLLNLPQATSPCPLKDRVEIGPSSLTVAANIVKTAFIHKQMLLLAISYL